MPGVGRPRTIFQALVAWYALVLALGAVGLWLGALVPCERGLQCLTYPFGGALVGALLGALAAALLAARVLHWWWLPMTLILVGVGALLGNLAQWLGVTLCALAPVIAALTAVREREQGPGSQHQAAGRPRRWVRGVAALTAAAVLFAGSWWMLDRRERATEIAMVEAVDAPLVAPEDPADLRVTTLTTSDDLVRYTLARGESPDAAYLDVTLRRGGGGCTASGLQPCTDLGDGISVYRQAGGEHWVVFRDLGDSHLRASDQSQSGREPWAEDEAVDLVRGMVPVDAAVLVDRQRRGR